MTKSSKATAPKPDAPKTWQIAATDTNGSAVADAPATASGRNPTEAVEQVAEGLGLEHVGFVMAEPDACVFRAFSPDDGMPTTIRVSES